MKRIVITGLGVVTPLGCKTEVLWRRLLSGKSGIRKIVKEDCRGFPSQIAGLVPALEEDPEAGFVPPLPPRFARRVDRFILYALSAAQSAVADSGWTPTKEEDLERTGVSVGSGIGGLETIGEGMLTLTKEGRRKISPFFIPSSLVNLAAGQISLQYGFQGPNQAPATACTSGAHAIGDAARIIERGEADVMVAGGSEAGVCPLGMAGFCSARALSTRYNDDPVRASRPWDRDRDGFVIGEGSGILVLEDLAHAKKRGAKIYGELLGYGMSGDGYHVTNPPPDGRGARKAMQAALRSAQCPPEKIDYINAHGTSTPVGDKVEHLAVREVFGTHKLAMSSTKSAIGHALGASGAIEAVVSLMALRDQVVPPTLNLEEPDCEGLNLVPKEPQERSVDRVLSNSFGFGGTNAVLLLAKFS